MNCGGAAIKSEEIKLKSIVKEVKPKNKEQNVVVLKNVPKRGTPRVAEEVKTPSVEKKDDGLDTGANKAGEEKVFEAYVFKRMRLNMTHHWMELLALDSTLARTSPRWISTLSEWKDKNEARLIMDMVRLGLRLPFGEDRRRIPAKQRPAGESKLSAELSDAVRTLVQNGTVELCECPESYGTVSPVFLAKNKHMSGSQKPGKKPRVILFAAHTLNPNLEPRPFKLPTIHTLLQVVTTRRQCWMAKLDIKDCYYSFPIHPAHRPHLSFNYDGKRYQFTRLPSGVSCAPSLCEQMLSVVSHALRTAGIEHVRYCDDFVLVGGTETETNDLLQKAQAIIESFGFEIQAQKTKRASQTVEFLGWTINTAAQTVSCDPNLLQNLCGSLRSGRMPAARAYLSRIAQAYPLAQETSIGNTRAKLQELAAVIENTWSGVAAW